jgi:hypothetical protein
VHPLGRRNLSAKHFHAARVALIGVVLPNEFKERIPLGHFGAVFIAGTIVDADPSINRIDISAIVQPHSSK